MFYHVYFLFRKGISQKTQSMAFWCSKLYAPIKHGIVTILYHYFTICKKSWMRCGCKLPTRKLTWHLKIEPWKRRCVLETIIFTFHVSFPRRVHFARNYWQLPSLGKILVLSFLHFLPNQARIYQQKHFLCIPQEGASENKAVKGVLSVPP